MESLAYVLTSGWASGINVYATIVVVPPSTATASPRSPPGRL
jgi:hypothetical protein